MQVRSGDIVYPRVYAPFKGEKMKYRKGMSQFGHRKPPTRPEQRVISELL